jgi:hypothetical protein
MEKIKIEFTSIALAQFLELENGENLYFSQLAKRSRNELEEFPPEKWGRIRQECGSDTFVSGSENLLDIRGYFEETSPVRTLWITTFKRRTLGRKKG